MMSFEIRRQILQTALAFLAALQISPIFGLEGQEWHLPYTIPLTIALLLLFIHSLRVERRAHADFVRQNQIFGQAAGALFEHSMVSFSDEAGSLTFLNENMLKTTGYNVGELEDKSENALFFEEDLDDLKDIEQSTSSGHPWQGEFRLRRKDGSAIWTNLTMMPTTDEAGVPTGRFVVCTDITAVKNAASQKQIFDALEELSDQVFLLDAETFEFLYMNRIAVETYRLEGVDYHGKRPSEIIPAMSDALVKNVIGPLIKGECEFLELPAKVGRRDIEMRIQLIDTHGAQKQLMVVIIDVTAKREAERARANFVADVSHELRTPLTSIKGAMGLLLSGAAGEIPARAQGMLEIAHRNADRLVAIINDLLDIEKIAAGQMPFHVETVDISALVKEAINTTQSFADRFDVTFMARGIDTPLLVEVDSDRTMQVVTNLLSNAAKFSKPGGTVDLELTTLPGKLRIDVCDYGKGIPAEMLPKIFERFTQAHREGQTKTRGTGLGLAIVKAITEQQGGKVSVMSKEGRGSVFSITLPLPEAEQASASADRNVA